VTEEVFWDYYIVSTGKNVVTDSAEVVASSYLGLSSTIYTWIFKVTEWQTTCQANLKISW
jgi:hypothetical protein